MKNILEMIGKRDIEFRAWCGTEMVYSSEYIHLGASRYSEGGFFEDCEECDIMQYIGFKDKNKKKIFEGDIIRFGSNLCVVVYKAGGVMPGFVLMDVDGDYQGFYREDTNLKAHEIVGNIFENPEMFVLLS